MFDVLQIIKFIYNTYNMFLVEENYFIDKNSVRATRIN